MKVLQHLTIKLETQYLIYYNGALAARRPAKRRPILI